MYIYDYLDMKSILEQLSSMTVVVADTGDLDSIKKFLFWISINSLFES